MKAEAIPAVPDPITAEQARAMSQRRLKKHHVAIVIVHWFNAVTWLLELATGAGLVVSRHFRVAPAWFTALVEGVFGTRANMLRFHEALGLAWIVVFLVYASFGWRTYLRAEVMHREMGLDRNDWRWLAVRAARLVGRSREALPPQGSYNAGQKLFGWLVYTMVPLVMATGVVMTFRLIGPAVVGWAIPIHFAAVGAVLAGLMVHVYMGAVFPEEKSAFFSMVSGTVDELYAYNHHFTWWREMKLAEREWMRRHDREAEGAVAAPVPDADEPGGTESPD